MKLKISISAFVFALVAAHAATNDLTGLLQKGLFEEEANRDLDAAISNYQTLAGQFDKDRQIAGTAIFRLGECYRKLGKTNEAVAQYQRILHDFSDQQTLATLSRQNLTGLGVTGSSKQTAQSQDLSLDMQALQQQIVEAQALLAQNEIMLKNLKSMNLDDLRKALPSIIPDGQFDTLMKELDLAEQQLINLRNDYSQDHPRYQSAQALVQDLNQKVKDRIDGILLGLQAKVNAENAYLDALKAKTQNAQSSNPSERVDALKAELDKAQASTTDEEQQEIRRIQVMIQDSPDLINSPGGDGHTPLQVAAIKGQVVVARYLLDHGADVNGLGRSRVGSNNGSPLYFAALNGHKAVVELLLARGANVNGSGDLNPLFQAVSQNYYEVASVLLANNADANPVNGSQLPPLAVAAVNNQTNLAQLLLSHGARVDIKNNDGHTPLFFAATDNSVDTAKILLAAGANIEVQDNNGETPLHGAAFYGRAEIISFLLNAGARVDATNFQNATPLLLAVANGRVEAVRALLEHKADPNHKGTILNWAPPGPNSRHSDWTAPPVYFAVALTNNDILGALLDHGASPDGMAGANWNPLTSAINANYADGVQLLLDHGVNLAGAPKADESPLNEAVDQRRDPRIIKALLDKGADPNALNKNGLTPLMSAIDPDVVRWLVEHKADVNARSKKSSWTPLMINNVDSPEKDLILLTNGANPNLENANGNTALHEAVQTAQTNIIAVLLEHKANPNIQNNDGLTPLDLALLQAQSHTAGHQFISAEIAKQIVDILTKGGGLANLPKRDRIEVRRGSNFSNAIFAKDTQDRNHYSLLELIAANYDLLSTMQGGPWPSTAKGVRWALWSNNNLPFPDFKKITIYRRSGNDTRQKAVEVNAEDILKSGDCSHDVPLQWGDIVEIPEADHPVDQKWHGLDEPIFYALTNCIARQVTLKIKGETNILKLSPEIVFNNLAVLEKFTLIQASFMLRSVLDNSKLLRVSSDLAHVKVTRHDPISGKTQEWTIDCTSPSDSDLWLRDGDIIDVPDK